MGPTRQRNNSDTHRSSRYPPISDYAIIGDCRTEGYQGSRPVRIGNAAHSQLQLDTYGALVLAVHDYLQRGGALDAREARVLVSMGRFVCRNWMRPDKGIWELRGEPRHNTHSKLMCWVALDCLLRLSGKGLLKVPQARFETERDKIAQAIHTQGYDARRGTFTGAFDNDYVDAGLLLLAVYGFLDVNDPRMVATWKRIEEELVSNGLLFRHNAGDDSCRPGAIWSYPGDRLLTAARDSTLINFNAPSCAIGSNQCYI